MQQLMELTIMQNNKDPSKRHACLSHHLVRYTKSPLKWKQLFEAIGKARDGTTENFSVRLKKSENNSKKHVNILFAEFDNRFTRIDK